jgi:TnpA family transposase
MATEKRIKIITESEVQEFYSPPLFTTNDQRFFFALDDREQEACKKVRQRRSRCMLTLLLGYFKAKPVILIPRYHQVKADLKYISQDIIPGPGFTPFTLTQKEKDRLYSRILELTGYQDWSANAHLLSLVDYLKDQSRAWLAPRHLFDSAIEYLSKHKIAIPAYSTLQKIIGQVANQEHAQLNNIINAAVSNELRKAISDLFCDDSELNLSQLRQSAKNFTKTELNKELAVHRYLLPWISKVDTVLQEATLSQKNLQYFADRVDYYGAKLKRHSEENQQLYLLCYLHFRWHQALERIADGFVHHVRQTKQKGKAYAQNAVYEDWHKASKNVSKAADVLHLFIDDNIDHQQSFGEVRKKALNLLDKNEIESVCLFLREQKRSIDEATWQYYDECHSLRSGLLRDLFSCLQFEGYEGCHLLAATLNQARLDFVDHDELSPSTQNVSLLPKKLLSLLQGEEDAIKADRYEWYLYLQIPSRLNGQLTLPIVTKYRSLDADLVSCERWSDEKNELLDKSQLHKLIGEPQQVITDMNFKLNNRLQHVSDYLEQADNSNIILRNAKGKRVWRLPSTTKKHLVNNPFFQQMQTTGVADVLRMVDRDTKFIGCFKHVLGAQSKSRAHEYDLLAILVANATNQGIYGISQISDRTYDQLSAIQSNYIRLETLNDAIDTINNATARLPIFKHYNIYDEIVHASADGQKFESRRETFKTRYSSKYFGTNKGVSSVSLIANHAAINAHVIGANEHESHFIFDLLMSNSSEINPNILSTDTHGVNHVNFALLDLFGYTFAPRYAKVGNVINEIFDVIEDKSGCVDIKLKKPINIKCIIKYWDTIQRICISLKERKTTQATLVRKLSGYKNNHPLLEALTEYNRLVKASYLLSYIDDASLRNYVQRALNRGEAYHQLRRAISNVNGDRFRGNSDEEIQLWNECARLLANAIIYFNSSVLSRLLDSFEHQDDLQKIEIAKQASPVAWYNINLKGTYNFELSDDLPNLEEMMRSIDGYLPV